MRDLLLGGVIFGICIVAFKHPWVGVLGWTWVSIMNPHAYSWTLSSLPVAATVAATTLIGLLITRDRRVFSLPREGVVLVLFMIWICITAVMAFDPTGGTSTLSKVLKIDLMVLVSLFVLHSEKQIKFFIWVVAGSIAYYGIKGGIFTVLTGGGYRVWGPPNTYIEGNNELALALIMVIPLLNFLRLQYPDKRAQAAFIVSMLLCAGAAIGSHSRGALLAIVAMGGVLWWRSEKKTPVFLLACTAALAVAMFMPEHWWSRMDTIGTYQEDASAMGRINAWWMAWNLATDNFFGGGFSIYDEVTFARYAPDPFAIHAAHSIYFQVLGEHGFVGLLLFLGLWIFTWRTAGKLRKDAQALTETRWASSLGAMCQVSLAGYAVGGAFLSLAYYDLPYNIMIIVVVANRWVLETTSALSAKGGNMKSGLTARASGGHL